jgi:hypothetical protein
MIDRPQGPGRLEPAAVSLSRQQRSSRPPLSCRHDATHEEPPPQETLPRSDYTGGTRSARHGAKSLSRI